MKKLFIVLCICLVSMSCKQSVKTQEPALAETKEEGFKETEYAAENELSIDLSGLWGDFSFLEKLEKEKSIGNVYKLLDIRFPLDIKISDSLILINHYYYIEPAVLDTELFEIITKNDSSFYLRNKETGQQVLYRKMMNLAEEKPDLWSFYEDKYSAISLMTWKWFQGKYEYTDLTGNNTRTVEFTADGFFVDGGKKIPYYPNSYLPDDDFGWQDYLLFEHEINDYRYYLMEYSNNIFTCYSVKYFDDWEDPFEKDRPVFTLKKL